MITKESKVYGFVTDADIFQVNWERLLRDADGGGFISTLRHWGIEKWDETAIFRLKLSPHDYSYALMYIKDSGEVQIWGGCLDLEYAVINCSMKRIAHGQSDGLGEITSHKKIRRSW